MSTTLSATGRITIPYSYSGINHKARFYCRGIQAVGGSFNINSRTLDANDIVWTDAAQAAAQCVNNYLGIVANIGQAVLEKLIGGLWQAQAYFTVTPIGTTGGQQATSQLTIVLRDRLAHPVKVVFLEGKQVPPQHWATPFGGDADLDNVVHYLVDTTLSANSPFAWMVGRSNQYLNDTPFVGATVSLNRKLRRRRGLA